MHNTGGINDLFPIEPLEKMYQQYRSIQALLKNGKTIEIGGLECVVDHVARHDYAEPIWLTLVGKSVGRLL